jgi:hypothetical protein
LFRGEAGAFRKLALGHGLSPPARHAGVVGGALDGVHVERSALLLRLIPNLARDEGHALLQAPHDLLQVCRVVRRDGGGVGARRHRRFRRHFHPLARLDVGRALWASVPKLVPESVEQFGFVVIGLVWSPRAGRPNIPLFAWRPRVSMMRSGCPSERNAPSKTPAVVFALQIKRLGRAGLENSHSPTALSLVCRSFFVRRTRSIGRMAWSGCGFLWLRAKPLKETEPAFPPERKKYIRYWT